MAQPSTAWSAKSGAGRALHRKQGRGALLALLLALAISALSCTREEPPAHAPPPPGPQAGTVLVQTQPPGLELVADGTVRCRTPCSFRIDPGVHRLSIHRFGYMPWQESVEVRPGAEVKVSAALVSSH
jgi:hypothetical protein